MLRVFHFSLLFGLLIVCTAQESPCTVTQHAGWTHYSIPEFKAAGCHYSWTNSTNHVMANHEGKTEHLVVNTSSTTLTTNVCFEQIHYKRDCISEETQLEVTCTTNCSGNAGWLHNEKADNSGNSTGDGIHHYWIGAVVAFIAVLVGLLICIARKLNRYKAVKRNIPGVEAQRG